MPGKLHYVPNGIAPAFWAAGSRESGRARLGLAPNEIAVSYTGTIGMAHGLGTVAASGAPARDVAAPRALFHRRRRRRARSVSRQRAAESRSVEREFTGLLPRQQIADILAASDITLVTLKPAETFKSVLPSKMFEAMAAGKPIVLAVEGEARQVLEQAQAGLPVPPGDAVALARAVAKLAQKPDLRERLGTSGSAFVASEFNRAVWADRYLNILAEASHADLKVGVTATASGADVKVG